MRAREFVTEVNIDNRKGAGAVPFNADIDYFGLRVDMKPSTFLKLALPLEEPTSVEGLKAHMASGGSIGAQARPAASASSGLGRPRLRMSSLLSRRRLSFPETRDFFSMPISSSES